MMVSPLGEGVGSLGSTSLELDPSCGSPGLQEENLKRKFIIADVRQRAVAGLTCG